MSTGAFTPGVSTLIARRGKIVHPEQFGWRDKEAQSPMSADTIFRLYSMTKPIICVGADDAARGGALHAPRPAGEISSRRSAA